MIVPLLLALLLPISPACAAEGPVAESAPAIESAYPDLLGLEKDLAGKLEQKNSAMLKLEDHQEWVKEFRTRLAAVIERVSPSPENQAAHARIKAMLGDRKEAGAALDQALGGDPDNPVLLRTKGQFLLEQEDYGGAAKHGLRAYEISGRTDRDALALYHAAKGRTAPTGANSVTPTGGSTPGATAEQVDSRTPYRLPVKGNARVGEVPNLVADDASGAPTQDNGNGFGLLTKLGVAAGVLLIAWGAVPSETKAKLKQNLWEQPKQEMKTIAIVGAAAGAVYLGVTYIPPLFATVAPAASSTLVPALSAGGTAAGGVARQQAAVGTVKAGLLAGGSTIVLKKASDFVSNSASDSGTQSSPSSISNPEANPRSSIKKPAAKNQELQKVIDKLFKSSDRKPGGTARAARSEYYSGEATKGKWHRTPAKERLSWLRRVMQEQKLDPVDRATAEALEADLQSAINLYKITP